MKSLVSKIQKNRTYYRNRIKEVLKEFPISEVNVLDLGCGEMLLREYVKPLGCNYCGVDQLPLDNKENFISSDILSYDFDGSSFDIIFLLGVIDHMPFREKELVLERVQDHYKRALIFSQFNTGNILFRVLFPNRKAIDVVQQYKGSKIRKLALFKFPFFQRIFKLNDKGFFAKYIATEFVYRITKEIL